MAEATDQAALDAADIPSEPVSETSKYDRSIIEGPLGRAVWKIAWPTMLTNAFAGLQGMVDHILVGNLVGYRGNAAMGISYQIFLAVIVFIASIFTGMSVLVARFVGAGEVEKVNRTVYQAFLVTIILAAVVGPIGYFATPYLLDFVSSDAGVKAEALPFLRVSFVFAIGLMLFFMVSGALRAAGDAKTPMMLGITMTILNLILNIVFIRGLGPIPGFGTTGAAIGTSIATGIIGIYSIYKMWKGDWVINFPRGGGWAPDGSVIRSLFRFGLPTGFQGIAMNIGGVLMLYFIGSLAQSAAAQAAYSVAYTQLFALVTWTAVGLMGAAAAVAGQNLGAGQPERTVAAVHTAARFGALGSVFLGLIFFFFPQQLLGIFGMDDPVVTEIGVQLLRVLSISGLFVSTALTYTGGLQGTGDTKSPLYISIVSQMIIPLGACFAISHLWGLQPMHIWLAILAGHITRFLLSFARFNQGKWRNIAVDIGSTKS
ncbi:MAG: MATE family efflux transporter [Acidobacteria bacterium]|nr:MATE family efflux transporter [Acidobacteriota bacterium]